MDSPPPPPSSSTDSSIHRPPPSLREDQVANAVRFLSHPSVRAAVVSKKNEFLVQKGLTPPEISEAFRRSADQPAPPPTTSSAPADNTSPHLPPSLSTPPSYSSAYPPPPPHPPPYPYYGQASPPPPPPHYGAPMAGYGVMSPYGTSSPTAGWSWQVLRGWAMPVLVSLSLAGIVSQLWTRYRRWRALEEEEAKRQSRRSQLGDPRVEILEEQREEGFSTTSGGGHRKKAAGEEGQNSEKISVELKALRETISAMINDQTDQIKALCSLMKDMMAQQALTNTTTAATVPSASSRSCSRVLLDSLGCSEDPDEVGRAELSSLVQKVTTESSDKAGPPAAEGAKKSLGTLMLILSNLLQNPRSEKYRKINIFSPRFRERFGDSPTSVFRLLSYLGYRQEGQIYTFNRADTTTVEVCFQLLKEAYDNIGSLHQCQPPKSPMPLHLAAPSFISSPWTLSSSELEGRGEEDAKDACRRASSVEAEVLTAAAASVEAGPLDGGATGGVDNNGAIRV
eukprot:GHVS01048842.1.p1 GENE.GHVS01048842.1~~GHVS01048842.1.p1  ORF type:complete len:510 (+),score=134.63 GHVS01048842.1:201-1730(+)